MMDLTITNAYILYCKQVKKNQALGFHEGSDRTANHTKH